jgi:hypothetical protein
VWPLPNRLVSPFDDETDAIAHVERRDRAILVMEWVRHSDLSIEVGRTFNSNFGPGTIRKSQNAGYHAAEARVTISGCGRHRWSAHQEIGSRLAQMSSA